LLQSTCAKFAGLRRRLELGGGLGLDAVGEDGGDGDAIVLGELQELELPYLLVNVGRAARSGGHSRERSGRMMVPWLSDPNTGREMLESADIVRYLHQTHAAA
jgi:hypothetical protein